MAPHGHNFNLQDLYTSMANGHFMHLLHQILGQNSSLSGYAGIKILAAEISNNVTGKS
jgi:hypothetical protein